MPGEIDPAARAARVVPIERDVDLLVRLPLLLGREVDNSLVLVLFRDARSCATARFDLPIVSGATDRGGARPSGRPRGGAGARGAEDARRNSPLVRGCAAVVASVDMLDGVAIIVLTDQRLCEGAPPWQRLVRDVARVVDDAGAHVVAQLCQARNGWSRYPLRGADD